MTAKTPLIELRDLQKHYRINKGIFGHRTRGTVKAVDSISLSIAPEETLGLIGESGCGKSTLSRVLLGLTPATGGEVLYDGRPVNRRTLPQFRREAQMIFQDPYSSLDPRMNIEDIIGEPLRVHTRLDRKARRDVILPLLEQVGLSEDALSKYPHEFSGGQRQRIGIARALVLEPRFIVCDEPVSALDMSILAHILNLLAEMKKTRRLTCLFISHDMSVVKHISDRIAVMYLGHIVELAEKEELFRNTLHPYTAALMNAIPVPNPALRRKIEPLPGDLPSPIDPPPGCPFQTRCAAAQERCRREMPALNELLPGHFAACHFCKGGVGA